MVSSGRGLRQPPRLVAPVLVVDDLLEADEVGLEKVEPAHDLLAALSPPVQVPDVEREHPQHRARLGGRSDRGGFLAFWQALDRMSALPDTAGGWPEIG